MVKKRVPVPSDLQPWVDARQQFRLSHAHVQMARELELSPKKFGKLANHHQEPWKLPLPDFIAGLYFKRFGKTMPDTVRTIEPTAAARTAKQQAKKARKSTSAEIPPVSARCNAPTIGHRPDQVRFRDQPQDQEALGLDLPPTLQVSADEVIE